MFSGPSGVGKDTVLDAWISRDTRVRRVVTTTTRAPRPGERNGVDYDFLDAETFLMKARNEEFLEFKEVHGHWYASPLAPTVAIRDAGGVAVLKIDVQGAMEAMVKLPDALTVFLLPPSEDELARRLRGRGTEDEEALARRLRNALDEIDLAHRYHHRLVNENVDDTVASLISLTA